jgi:hypothetical protein
VQHFTVDEVKEPEVQKTIQVYHSDLESNIGNNQYDTSLTIDDFINDDIHSIGSDDEEEDDNNYYGLPPSVKIDDVVDNSDARLASDSYDKYIGAELSLPDRKGSNLMAKVMKKVINADMNDGNNYNPMIDESVYEVTFSDGTTEELAANVIAENMYSNVDSKGHHYKLMHEIMDHKKDNLAIQINNGFIVSKSGNKVPKKTTRGWELLVEWKDGSMDWVPLVELKASFPIELSEYALANGIEEEPAFKWWVKQTMRRRDRIISMYKSKKSPL